MENVSQEVFPIWYDGLALRWNEIPNATSYTILTTIATTQPTQPGTELPTPPWEFLCKVPVNFYAIPLQIIGNWVCGKFNNEINWGRPSPIPHGTLPKYPPPGIE